MCDSQIRKFFIENVHQSLLLGIVQRFPQRIRSRLFVQIFRNHHHNFFDYSKKWAFFCENFVLRRIETLHSEVLPHFDLLKLHRNVWYQISLSLEPIVRMKIGNDLFSLIRNRFDQSNAFVSNSFKWFKAKWYWLVQELKQTTTF